jgi:hypothetical protein
MSGPFLSTIRTWRAMINRCESTLDARYRDYGGRGIKVCAEWHDFKVFLADMGMRPFDFTLERKDNNGAYCKANCKWATSTENNLNRRLFRKAKNNSSGITGVSWYATRNCWRAFGGRDKLYQGDDFFKACCARKSWEARLAV